MKKIIQILMVTLLLSSFSQCSSYDKIKYENNKKIIKEASNNKKVISLYRQGSTKNIDDAQIGFVNIRDSLNGIFDFKYLVSENKINSLKIIKDVDSVSFIGKDEKLKLILPDNSFLIGSIISANPEENLIIFATQHHKYSIPKSKIISLKFFNTSYVKVIFVDGSMIFGTIKGDDSDNISLTTIFGDVSYSRDEINKIEYIQ